MNSPFVVEQAATWAKRVLAQPGTPEQRIAAMYETAFGRPPATAELRDAVAFLADQGARRGCPPEDVGLWADLCHVLFNVKEFIFLD
jgi:hypothetical protein